MPAIVPSLSRRVYADERMDDMSIRDERLEAALHELRYVNRYLGGYRALRKALGPIYDDSAAPVTVLDLGCGICDNADRMVRWGEAAGVTVRVTAIDANPATVSYADKYLDSTLPTALRDRVGVILGDAQALAYDTDAFHVVTASLFLHHFDDDGCVQLLSEMSRIGSRGVVVNDLHRHLLAYAGIRAISALLPVSPMFRHDGPLSVRRAFRPRELAALAAEAGLPEARVRRHRPYRLTLSTL